MTARRTPFTYPSVITFDTLSDLLAFHRRTFGGWRMEDDDDDGGKDNDDGKDTYKPPASQADLDRIISERLRRQAETKFSDYGDLKAKAQAHDKAIEAARTDQEKAVEAAKNEGRTEARTEANARLVSAEARALAAEAKFRNPILAVRALDLSAVKVNDDGSVDAAAIKTALKELSDAEPYLIDDGKGGRPKPDNGQGRTGGDSKPSVARGRELYAERNKKTSA